MSTHCTLNLRANVERFAALALSIVTAATVAGGAIAMCLRPLAG
jgi:hypothetical protein